MVPRTEILSFKGEFENSSEFGPAYSFITNSNNSTSHNYQLLRSSVEGDAKSLVDINESYKIIESEQPSQLFSEIFDRYSDLHKLNRAFIIVVDSLKILDQRTKQLRC